jgi:serine/threonine-protein kinase RsbW
MATVELSFTPLPAHVRTARLVATAVARRSGLDESLLDEVRLAVGEACSRAVEAHRLHCPAEPVRIQLSDRDGRFEVVVTDAVPGGVDDPAAHVAVSQASSVSSTGGLAGGLAAREAAATDKAGADVSSRPAPGGQAASDAARGGAATPVTTGGVVNGSFSAGIGLAVIAGLADDVQISATGDSVSIRMSWPLPELA